MSLQSRKGNGRRKVLDRFFGAFCSLSILFAGVLLVSLLWNVWQEGAPRLGLMKEKPVLRGKLKIGTTEELQPVAQKLADRIKGEAPDLAVEIDIAQASQIQRKLVFKGADIILAPAPTALDEQLFKKNNFASVQLPLATGRGARFYLFANQKALSGPGVEWSLRTALESPSAILGGTAFEPLPGPDYEAAISQLDKRAVSSAEKFGDFVQSFPSQTFPERAGIKAALMGTLWVVGLTALFSIPIGIGAAIFLEEFTLRKTKLTAFIQLNISNLAGVPSIVYGLLGLALFVRWFALDKSVISGALTMSLLILPMIIIVSQEALRAVPRSYRDGSYAMGATHWQTIRRQVLPSAMPGILTGIILAISRAIGETAPIITIGAASFLLTVPHKLGDSFTALPIQIYDWIQASDRGFRPAAAAAILVLLAALILLNSIAIFLRYRYQKRV